MSISSSIAALSEGNVLYLQQDLNRARTTFRGQKTVGTRGRSFSSTTTTLNAISSGSTVSTFGVVDTIPEACTDIRFMFTNAKTTSPAADIIAEAGKSSTIKVGLEVSADGTTFTGSTIFPITFNGQDTYTFSENDVGVVYTDPFPYLGANALIRVRTAVFNALTGDIVNSNVASVTALLDRRGNGTDVAYSGTVSTAGGASYYGPFNTIGTRINQSKPSLVVVGDSITAGTGDSVNQYAWFSRGLNANSGVVTPLGGYAAVNVAQSGCTLAQWTVTPNASVLVRQIPVRGADIAVVMLGTNDFNTDSLATMKTNTATLVTFLKQYVSKVFWATIVPKTTSTDGWTTAGNQTPTAQESTRTGFNDWLRDTSSSGAIAQAGITGIFETADTVEVNGSNVLARNGGRWKVTGGVDPTNGDGVHPNTASHTLMSAAVDLTKLVL